MSDNPVPQVVEPLDSVVCLGASAGGLEALQEFFGAIPTGMGVPFVVVVHLSPDFKSLMPELLAKHTRLTVHAAEDDTTIEKDHVYIIPSGKNMTLEHGKLKLRPQDRTPGHALNLPIDLFLHSMADAAKDRGIAVILSGTGSDGTRGVQSVKEAGGVVMVQRPESAKFNGMPLSVINTGISDHQDTPAGLAQRVFQLVTREIPLPAESEGSDEGLGEVCAIVKTKTGMDISCFRRRMLHRRVYRRMALREIDSLRSYITLLTRDDAEAKQLHDDLLIGVTGFFRDSFAFDALQSKAIQDLLLQIPKDETFRVWIAACSKGHEVYSIAIAIREAMRISGITRDLTIFATDIDERSLRTASLGVYTLSEVSGVPTAILSRYFEQEGGSYRIRGEIRESVIFARHNLVTDPPFIRMHLVSCRNLLIYLETKFQERVLASLFSALRPDQGVLFLGTAETPGFLESALHCLDSKARVYRRSGDLPGHVIPRVGLPEPISVISVPAVSHRSTVAEEKTRAEAMMLRRVLEAYFEDEEQSAAIVDEDRHVVQVLTDPLSVFRLPKGAPSTDLSRLFGREVFAAMAAAQQRLSTGVPGASYTCRPAGSGEELLIQLRKLTSAQDQGDGSQGLNLLTLKKHGEQAASEQSIGSVDTGAVERIGFLEQELRETKESLQATIEELQSSNEEQQSTNEELIASNEELQSTNEELQSMNEELFTINTEYNKKNQELQTLSADLDELMNRTNVATLHLDSDLRVLRFTKSIGSIIPLQATDLGRSVSELAYTLDLDLARLAGEVLSYGGDVEREVRDSRGSWILMRLSPCADRLEGNPGVLATFLDITRIKNAEQSATLMSERLARSNLDLRSKSEQVEDLFSIVAHDLKRPVMALDGALQLASRKLAATDLEGATRRIDGARDALGALRTMLKDLSDVSQLSRVDVKMESVAVDSWLDLLLSQFTPRAEERKVRLSWTSDHGHYKFARAAADVIVNNLVENALIHGTSGQSPRIDVTCQIDHDRLRVSVSDNGRGIAVEHHGRIFEIFRRLTPEETQGTGVGLVAAKRFAERANGRLWVESDVGQGAKFIAEIPCRATGEGGEVVETILLVEDDDLDAKRVRNALRDYAMQRVKTLSDADEALNDRHYDLVLLDLSLPDGHGLQLLSKMEDTGGPSVVLLSGHTSGLSEETLRAAQVVGTFEKNEVESEEFLQVVKGSLPE